MDEVCLRQIRKCKHAKLTQSLKKATALPSLETNQLLRLTVALFVTEDTVKYLPAFLQAREESLRVKVL